MFPASTQETSKVSNQVDLETFTVEFYVTGFGPFKSSPENPTQILVSRLEDFLNLNPLKAFCSVKSCEVLETSAEYVQKRLLDVYRDSHEASRSLEECKSRDENSDNFVIFEENATSNFNQEKSRKVFIHFGVSVTSKVWSLELQAFNEAHFEITDERGYRPQHAKIYPDCQLSHTLRTKLPIYDIVQTMKQRGLENVEISLSAGRFVCNYCYYCSLHLAQRFNADSIFVHIPPFAVKNEEQQLVFMRLLLDTIADILQAQNNSSGTCIDLNYV